MTDGRAAVQAYLQSVGETTSWILLDEGLKVAETSGPLLDRLDAELTVGASAEGLDFLSGILPAREQTIVLRGVERRGAVFDVHLVPVGRAQLILLIDVDAAVRREQSWRQSQNEIAMADSWRARDVACLRALMRIRGVAVMERVQTGAFRVVGLPPAWFRPLIPGYRTSTPFVDPTAHSAFLSHFVEEAQNVWRSQFEGSLRSGPWTEPMAAGDGRVLEATAVRGNDGICLLYVIDASDRHRRETEVLQAARELSMQHQLLERAVASSDILLHCIVHDLTSPLAGIATCISAIQSGQVDEKTEARFLEIAAKNVEKQQTLIDQILEVFQLEQHAAERPSAVDISNVVRRASEELSPGLAARGVRLQIDTPDEAWARGDSIRLSRVLGNLIENASRHAPERSAIDVTVASADTGWRVVVADRGPGVPKDQQATLFAKLQQGPSRRGKLGLGLYFCKLTVERWEGTIEYQPREGGGAEFRFTLPVSNRPS